MLHQRLEQEPVALEERSDVWRDSASAAGRRRPPRGTPSVTTGGARDDRPPAGDDAPCARQAGEPVRRAAPSARAIDGAADLDVHGALGWPARSRPVSTASDRRRRARASAPAARAASPRDRAVRQLPGGGRRRTARACPRGRTRAGRRGVQPRAHAVAALRRRHHRAAASASGRRPMRRKASAIDLGLERPLPLVGDVRVVAAAAAPVRGGTPVRRRASARPPCRRAPPTAATRSTRAATRSPGIAPDTSTTCPSWRASIRPPATGRSMSSVIDLVPTVSMSPGGSELSVEHATTGSETALANQAIDQRGRAPRRTPRRGIRSRNGAQLAVGLAGEAVPASPGVERRARRRQRAARRARAGARGAAGARRREAPWRRCRAASSSATSGSTTSPSASAAAAAQRRQPGDDALEMRRERRVPPARPPSVAVLGSGAAAGTPTARRHSSKTSSTSASQNSTRTGRRRGPFGRLPLDAAVDAAARHAQRHAPRGPARHAVEGRARRRAPGDRRCAGTDRPRWRGNRRRDRPARRRSASIGCSRASLRPPYFTRRQPHQPVLGGHDERAATRPRRGRCRVRVPSASSHSTRRPNVAAARRAPRPPARALVVRRAEHRVAAPQRRPGTRRAPRREARRVPARLRATSRGRRRRADSAAGMTLMPMPTTTCSTRSPDDPASARMPASLRGGRPRHADVVRPLHAARRAPRGRGNALGHARARGHRQQRHRRAPAAAARR